MKLYLFYSFKDAMTKELIAPADDRPFDEQQIRDILRQVIDPEVGMNIVALGLVYRVELIDDRVQIEMTMTSPACPMGEMIAEDVRQTLRECLPAGIDTDVRLVWSPPWSPALMSEDARTRFGW